MDAIRELLDRIQELSDQELADLETKVLSEFETVEKQDTTPEIVDQMTQLADALDAVRTEQTTRAANAEELAAKAKEAAQRVHGASEEDEGEDTGDAETPAAPEAEETVAVAASVEAPEAPAPAAEEAAPEAEAPAEAEEEAPAADEPQAAAPAEAEAEAPAEGEEGSVQDDNEGSEGTVTAAANSGELAPITPPADRRPVPRQQATVSIVAGADIPGVGAGSELPNLGAVADGFVQRLHGMRRTNGGDGEQLTVATLVASFPEDRTLRANEQETNARKIADVAAPKAVTAAGGICAPVEVRYDIAGFNETLDRPVRDSLASFTADRGGIRYVTAPVLTDLTGAVSLWTLQDDIDAATDGAPDPVKPCLRVNCGDEETVYVDAIPLCMTFGNMGARAYPELIKRQTELAMVWQARYAETRLLTRIGNLSTQVSASHTIGAAPDFFGQVDRAVVAFRSRHRLDPNFPLRTIVPVWLRNMIRADLAMRMPGDGLEGNLEVADAIIDRFFAVRKVNPTWALDGEPGQVFGAQANGALQAWPNQVIWYLFPEGTFLFLDAGTLDLGLVRDSTLNGTNDYKMFVETFEGVAKIGIESLRVTSPLVVSGAVAGTVATQ